MNRLLPRPKVNVLQCYTCTMYNSTYSWGSSREISLFNICHSTASVVEMFISTKQHKLISFIHYINVSGVFFALLERSQFDMWCWIFFWIETCDHLNQPYEVWSNSYLGYYAVFCCCCCLYSIMIMAIVMQSQKKDKKKERWNK